MLQIQRYFTKEGVHPYDEITWTQRTVHLEKSDGTVIFHQDNVEAPDFWSDNAVQIAASKYFYESPLYKETSVHQLISRIAKTITQQGLIKQYFDESNSIIFEDELYTLMIRQHIAFNSPVLINIGVKPNEMLSACYINEVDDSIESIMNLASEQSTIFKSGAGSGVNYSTLRSSKEKVNGGGTSSGPCVFLKMYDSLASTIRSGGKARRSARMITLNMDHPDIKEFIFLKTLEEKKAKVLIDYGYDYNEATDSVFHQNGNNSVRVTDEFMEAAVTHKDWWTKYVTTKEPCEKYNAYDMLRWIAEATYACGDPGIQFDTISNEYNTLKNVGRIHTTNVCGEVSLPNNSQCNLCAINVIKYLSDTQSFDKDAYQQTIHLAIIAQDLLTEMGSAPSAKIAEVAKKTRPLGLGLTNLGALLMTMGIPYNSDEGREFAAALYNLATAKAYTVSSELAEQFGCFESYDRESMFPVLQKHSCDSHRKVSYIKYPTTLPIIHDADILWTLLDQEPKAGFRNATVTTSQPTGTVAYILNCDTTGIEPAIGLVVSKKLSSGGYMNVSLSCVEQALRQLHYSPTEIDAILSYIASTGSIKGSSLHQEHLPIFETAIGDNVVSPTGHIDMMASVQPFISMSISKSVNCPNDTTIEQIMDIYIDAWRKGLKAVSIYRDGSKNWQPMNVKKAKEDKQLLNTKKTQQEEKLAQKEEQSIKKHSPIIQTQRMKLPDERQAITHRFEIAGHEGYITVGLYSNGAPGELFIVMSKEGSTISGLLDGFAILVSMALQHGVPLQKICDKMIFTRFEPAGMTKNPDIRIAKSIFDYIFRWMKSKFIDISLPLDDDEEEDMTPTNGTLSKKLEDDAQEYSEYQQSLDGPSCPTCGTIMIRQGSCYYCTECGSTTGCS